MFQKCIILFFSFSFSSRLTEYKRGTHKESNESAQQSLESSFWTAQQHYSPDSSRQRAISQAIVNDLIIGCNLPLSIVENEHFRHFLHTLDMEYVPISRMTITEKCIPDLVGKAYL